jgi:hypothetical protein
MTGSDLLSFGFVQAVVRVVVAARPHCFGVIENLTCANGNADKTGKASKVGKYRRRQS